MTETSLKLFWNDPCHESALVKSFSRVLLVPWLRVRPWILSALAKQGNSFGNKSNCKRSNHSLYTLSIDCHLKLWRHTTATLSIGTLWSIPWCRECTFEIPAMLRHSEANCQGRRSLAGYVCWTKCDSPSTVACARGMLEYILLAADGRLNTKYAGLGMNDKASLTMESRMLPHASVGGK